MSLETLEPSQVKKNTQETRENVVQTPEPSSDERDPVLIPCNYLGLANPQVQENFLEKNCSPARINADDITQQQSLEQDTAKTIDTLQARVQHETIYKPPCSDAFKLAEIVPEEYDYNANHFYQEYLEFQDKIELKKVIVKETILLENGRKVEIFENGVKKVELKAGTFRTVILSN